MTEKMYNLIKGIVTGVEAIVVAFVTYYNPPMAEAINASIIIVGTAIITICGKFVKENISTKK